MNNFNFGRFFSFLAFFAFAAVSCWATAESLYLSLDVPLAVCYVISIGFFIVASIGSVLIVKGLNPNTSVENPALYVWGGIFMVIAFWLLCSMPTNTHTFVYRDKVVGVVTKDVDQTLGYLIQLQNNDFQEEDIKKAQKKLESEVGSALRNLCDEIRNPLNPGFGKSAREKLNDLSLVLGVPIAETTIGARSSLSSKEREELINRIQTRVNEELNQKKQEIREMLTAAKTENFRRDANNQIANLRGIQYYIEVDSIDYYNRDMMRDIKKKLYHSYGTISTYRSFVSFDSPEDKYDYTRENIVTKVDGITSVFNVWKDIFEGKYNGHGLWYWIVLSILVDIAAFVFFDIAFAKSDED
ncbi:MAG: hypothetical protein MJZ90_08000 [Bacteroidales bacterium]|nr:hypothetical protein [Bacteroidales bacterium]